ncbi:hypothetical protein L873DRAFT_1819330 [Choiromyces venosus 120613-1]|uniref:Uncharacterized protein n=1 Tax=Choiromyces venosus 120613-1 TaxID=1336337 RepID=A0A3N4J4Y0_9PEZI|nr:hypothetical protein L873DRAFT_1819330 [Choiromyces venosus 120613-1]
MTSRTVLFLLKFIILILILTLHSSPLSPPLSYSFSSELNGSHDSSFSGAVLYQGFMIPL